MSEATPARDGVSDERIEQFEESKMNGETMIHRLRDWEAGDVVFGYDVVSDGASHGKTFRRGDVHGDEFAIERAINAVRDAPLVGDELSEGTVAFAWVGKVEKTRTEPPGPDPGEPPLKMAELEQVSVVVARSG